MRLPRRAGSALHASVAASALRLSQALQDVLLFSLESRGTNIDGSVPVYQNPKFSIEDRVADLLLWMTVQEKVARIIQGVITYYIANPNEPLDDTLAYNLTGLPIMNEQMSGALCLGRVSKAMEQNLGRSFTASPTTARPSPPPIDLSASFNRDLVTQVATVIGNEAEALGLSQVFAPVLDLSRELRWGRVEENYGEDPFLTGEMGTAYVPGVHGGRRQNILRARVAATCKHFAAFKLPQGGLNIAQVSGGERELRTNFLKPFNKACVDSLAIMTAYSSYDGFLAV
ncbi:Glycoside hydrolase family 3 protein [Mycena chlorophos]|uniref:beta-glucosidase n=1 Tax=Mycena chlorophos TaxID=658473 RepID=A0A8H6WJ99_MYCCL|nr:Glycoside hydrolase family 3 protein [Mycena chlorophos]